MPEPPGDLLVIGCGYLGMRIARRARALGWTVRMLTRDAERARSWAAEGYEPITGDVMLPESLASLPKTGTVVYAVGYDRTSGHSLNDVYVRGLANVVDRVAATASKFVYVSSTGVYGQNDGQWVDEDAVCEPTREGGQACLAAEKMLACSAVAKRLACLRLAGLYGPGRLPMRAILDSDQPIALPVNGYLNLIHVEDAADVVWAALDFQELPRTWNVSDGVPVIRREYYAEMARQLGVPVPQFVAPAAAVSAAERAQADKRVSNRRMLRDLSVELRFPSYREGLADCLKNVPQGPGGQRQGSVA